VIYQSAPLAGCPLDVCDLEWDEAGGCTPDPAAELKICPCRFNFVSLDTCDPGDLCPEPPGCEDDPDCPTPVPPPRSFAPPQDCGCLPLTVGRNCFNIPPGRDWTERALVIEVAAGSEPLKNLTLRAMDNLDQGDCCSNDNQKNFDDCDACSTLLVSYVPAGGVLRFDSVSRRVTVECDGRVRSAAKSVAQLDGLPFDWMVLGCQGACIMVDIDCGNTAPDVALTLSVATREL
jgi:hypothetical protein